MFNKALIGLLTLLATLIVVNARAEETPSAAEIVSAADKVRNPLQAFRVALALVEYQDGKVRDTTNLVVHSKLELQSGQYKNIVRYVAPARDVGKLTLWSAGSMWFYDPASRASIRISAQQRLLGQASTGDVLTANLAHDYTARFIAEESTLDADKVSKTALHLELSASTQDATYSRLETWIEKGSYRTIKSKFYSDSGRLLKLVYYRRYETQLGGERPMEVIIIDAVNSRQVTKISYSDFRAKDVKDEWFQRDYLPRFSEE